MSIATYVEKSVAKPHILLEIDITNENVQWVNIGAGIWYVNFDNTYTYVDATLLQGFSAQTIAARGIGSVMVDASIYQKVNSLAEMTTNEQCWYYDSAADSLYLRCVDSDEPFMHVITIGQVYGYSLDYFTPVGANQTYEGRLKAAPKISKKRDPLFFGRLQYSNTSAVLSNGDGVLDDWAETADIYGNEVRVKLGYDGQDITDYARLYTGHVGRVTIGEDEVSVSIVDKRKQLTAPITYSCTNKNALDAIVEIITTSYTNIQYNYIYFDTTAWAAAAASVANVTIDMQEPEPVNTVIEWVCKSVNGVFDVAPDGRYTFILVDTDKVISYLIPNHDVIGKHKIDYDPTEVVSSARVGYAKDWATTSNPFTWLTNTSSESAVFAMYKTKNQKNFETMLITQAAAQTFSDDILDYVKTIKGEESIEVPVKYYDLIIDDMVGVDISRPKSAMLGERKCEVIGIGYNLDRPTVNLDIRIVGSVESILTYEDSAVMITESSAILMED